MSLQPATIVVNQAISNVIVQRLVILAVVDPTAEHVTCAVKLVIWLVTALISWAMAVNATIVVVWDIYQEIVQKGLVEKAGSQTVTLEDVSSRYFESSYSSQLFSFVRGHKLLPVHLQIFCMAFCKECMTKLWIFWVSAIHYECLN